MDGGLVSQQSRGHGLAYEGKNSKALVAGSSP